MLVQWTLDTLHSYEEGWSCMYRSVILCGHDSTLLSTRKLILEQAGLSAQILFNVSELDHANGSVLVLCHTLSTAEKVKAVERYRSRLPGARVLLLGRKISDLACDGCETLSDSFGPELFLRRVKQLAS